VSDTKRCPYCAEEIRSEAIKCRFCGSLVEPVSNRILSAPWTRRRRDRVFAGVCVGLAEQFGISVTIVRLAFVLAALFSGGVAVLLYVALWLAMPLEPEPIGEEFAVLDPELPSSDRPSSRFRG
jgi:phage shock protein PspC (stress-responsive transcriptional regulator)